MTERRLHSRTSYCAVLRTNTLHLRKAAFLSAAGKRRDLIPTASAASLILAAIHPLSKDASGRTVPD